MVKSVSRGTARQTREAPKPSSSPVNTQPNFTPAPNFSPVNQNFTPNIQQPQPQNFSSVNQNFTPVNAAPTSQNVSRLPSQGASVTTPSLVQPPSAAMPSGGGSPHIQSPSGFLSDQFNKLNPNLVTTTNELGQQQTVDNPQVPNAGIGTQLGIAAAMGSVAPLGAFSAGAETARPISQVFKGLFQRKAPVVSGTSNAVETLNKGLYKTEYIFDESGSMIGKVNTKVAAQTTSRVGELLKKYGLALGTVSLGIGLITQTMQTWQMNQWSKVDNANFALNQAYQNALLSGDEQSLAQIKEMQQALTSEDFWSNLIPGAGLKVARDAMAMQYKMQNQLEADMQLLEQQRNFNPVDQGGHSTVVTPDGRIIQNTEKTNKNFFQEIQSMNREREVQQQEEDMKRYIETQKLIREEQAAARKAQRIEEAAFWEAERKKQITAENKQRDETAQFWLNYKRMVLELENNAFNARQQAFKQSQEDNAPSALSFGLLRS